MLPWLGRSPRRPVQPLASPRKPSTDASVSRCRPHDRLFIGRRPQRPAAADRSVRAPRAAGFPAPRRPLSTCSAPPLPLPRAEAPSADESLRADLSRRLAFASSSRVPCPGVNQCLRARAFGPFALLAYYVRSETGGRRRFRGSKNPGPASDMLSRAGSRLLARPAVPCRLFTGASEPHAAHRLLQSCSPTSTRIRTSKPDRTVLAKRPPTGSPSLGREEPADLCRHQGSPGDASPYRLPHSDRSPYGFTPARPRVGHPRVATPTPAVTGKGHRRLPAVVVPLSREDRRA